VIGKPFLPRICADDRGSKNRIFTAEARRRGEIQKSEKLLPLINTDLLNLTQAAAADIAAKVSRGTASGRPLSPNL
jgi:hypothetical protein